MTLLKELLAEFCADQSTGAKSNRPWQRIRPGILLANGREFFDFTSFDVFNLWDLPSIKRVALRELASTGFWPHSKRASGGGSPLPLERFEQRAAAFFGAGSAVAFDTRNQAVLTGITTLVGDGDIVFYDPSSDLPVADACSVSGARAAPVEIADLKQLRSETDRFKWARRRILVAESVNGVTGKTFSLGSIEALCNDLRIGVIWDDSFALGGYGLRGVPESDDSVWPPSRLLRFAALNRFAAGFGCVVAGPRMLLNTITARSHFLQSELPLPAFLATVASNIFDVLEVRVGDRERVGALWTKMSSVINGLGLQVLGDTPGPLLSLRTESRNAAEDLREALLGRGIVVDAISAPGSEMLGGVVRIILASYHDDRAVSALLNGLSEIRSRL